MKIEDAIALCERAQKAGIAIMIRIASEEHDNEGAVLCSSMDALIAHSLGEAWAGGYLQPSVEE